MPHQVFISYTERDQRIAEAIRDALEARSIRCWMAPRDVGPGQEWEAQIVEAIRATPILVLVFSEGSNESPQVQREVTLSVHYRADLLTYRIEDVTPEESLEYCLCKSHWMNAFQPLSADSLRVLCDAVASLLRRKIARKPRRRSSLPADAVPRWPGEPQAPEGRGRWLPIPAGTRPGEPDAVPGAAQAPEPLTAAARRRVLNLLVEEMFQQRGLLVRIDHWAQRDQEVVDSLEAEDVLLPRPSAFHPEQRFTTPATREQCRRFLAGWVAEHAAELVARWEERIDRLPALADGAGEFLAWQDDPAGHPLLRDLLPIDHASVGRVVHVLLERLVQQSGGPGPLIDAVVACGSAGAVYGLARGARGLLEWGQLDQAEAVYAAVERWGQARGSGAVSPRVLIELANEHGRLLRRRHRYREAETQFRQTLRRAEALGETTLAGIVANNLAGVLLDPAFLSEDRWREGVALLTANEQRFRAPAQRRHLAVTCNLLGEAYSSRDPARAETCFRRDVLLCREEGDEASTVDALNRLAVFLTRQGRCAEARQVHQEELAMCEGFPFPRRRARALANLGSSCLRDYTERHHPQQLAAALQTLETSCQLFSTLDEPRLFAPTLENYGHALLLSGAESAAVTVLKECVGQYRRLAHTAHLAEQVQTEIDRLESTGGEA